MSTHEYLVALTLKSSNAKTGPIPITYSSGHWCPDRCLLKDNGCYAEADPWKIWAKVTSGERGLPWPEFCEQIRARIKPQQLWRHNIAGDLPHHEGTIDGDKVRQLVDANQGQGFTYTHHDVVGNKTNREIVQAANADDGFTINLSANSPAEADVLLATGAGPVVCLLPTASGKRSFTPGGAQIVQCPAEYAPIQCANCKLCANGNRGSVVGFTPHGASKAAAESVASGAA
jgi:hypothetical protein